MSQLNQARGRFGGLGRGNVRSNGRDGQRDSGRFGGRSSYQLNRFQPASHVDDEENFMFDIYPNRVETVKFVIAQRKLCDYVATRYPDVSKIFSHGVEISHALPPKPLLTKASDPHHFKRDEYREKVRMILKREDEYNFNKKLSYGILWKHCSLALQNSIRGTSEYGYFSSLEDVSALWVEVKRLCTVGVITHADPEKVQRDADFRFSKVHQFNYESIPTFYDRYLHYLLGSRPETPLWMQK